MVRDFSFTNLKVQSNENSFMLSREFYQQRKKIFRPSGGNQYLMTIPVSSFLANAS
jgi:hypothetical protein